MDRAPTHTLLQRQIRRFFGGHCPSNAEMDGFLAAVDAAYRDADSDRLMLERSLELSSGELSQATAEMRGLFQATPDLIFRVDRDGTVLGLRPGAGPDPLFTAGSVGKRIGEIAPAAIAAQFAEAGEKVMRTSTVATIEYGLGAGGKPGSYEARLAPLGQREIIVMVRDITERRHLEEQFRQIQKMDAVGQLAGGIAHDFNNLLTVILGNLSLVRMGALEGAEKEAALASTVLAAERAAGLTRQLLTYSRRQPLKLQILEVKETIAKMTEMIPRLIGEHIALQTRICEESAIVEADPSMITQVILNLVVNSRDAMPQGGTLTLEAAVALIAADKARTNPRAQVGEHVRISVRDTGAGIGPDELPHLFEPFYTTKDVGKGTGLGLATVFGIVEQHRGWIEVESELGSGTAVHVFLPRAARRPEEGAAPAPRSALPRGSERILLVEDESDLRILLESVLRRQGYAVESAASGSAAIRVWSQNAAKFDLLVTDIVMPGGMDGRELTKRLRAEKPALGVLQCSGYNHEMHEEGAVGADAIEFLAKPFDPARFLERVRAVLDRTAQCHPKS